MTGKSYTITEVRHDWSDNGHNYWAVFFTREDCTNWFVRVTGSDELGAYVEATRRLDGAS